MTETTKIFNQNHPFSNHDLGFFFCFFVFIVIVICYLHDDVMMLKKKLSDTLQKGKLLKSFSYPRINVGGAP